MPGLGADNAAGFEADHTPGFEGDHLPGLGADHAPGCEADHAPGCEADHAPGFEGDRGAGFEGDHVPGFEADHVPGFEGDRGAGFEGDRGAGFEASRGPGFVAIEGIDGAGKSTFAARLTAELRRRDYLPVQLTEPSHGRYGQAARRLLAEGVAITDERLNQLFLADRRDHTARRTRPLLAVARERPGLGIVLVQDRSYYSSQAYQGLDEEAARAEIERYERVAVRPDLVLLLDVPLDVAAARIDRRPAAEQDVTSADVLGRARAVYLDLAARLSHFAVLDGTRPPDELAVDVAERYWPRNV